MSGSWSISAGTALSGTAVADVDALLDEDACPAAAAEAGERPIKRRFGGAAASAAADAMIGSLLLAIVPYSRICCLNRVDGRRTRRAALETRLERQRALLERDNREQGKNTCRHG